MNRLSAILRRSISVKVKKYFSTAKSELQPESEIIKSIKVAFIGNTNAGKSTLLNSIMGLPICAASRKAHTTRNFHDLFYVRGDTQVILIDTPGLVTQKEIKKFKLDDSFDKISCETLNCADLIGLVLDATCPHTRKSLPRRLKSVLQMVNNREKGLMLILNKVDLITDKREILVATDEILKGLRWLTYSRLFMVSALHNDGIVDIVDYIRSVAPVRKIKSKNVGISNFSNEEIVIDCVRAAVLERTAHEIPYVCTFSVDFLEEVVEGQLDISVFIHCQKINHERIILGPLNSRIYQIRDACANDLEKIFGKPVFLKLATVVKKK